MSAGVASQLELGFMFHNRCDDRLGRDRGGNDQKGEFESGAESMADENSLSDGRESER